MKQKNVLIFGAGSIGNHLSHACRRCKYNVHVYDPDKEALKRMQYSIYPQRYKKWDQNIQLFSTYKFLLNFYNLIIIGSPPNTKLKVLELIIIKKISFEKILFEKPFLPPIKKLNKNIQNFLKKNYSKIFIGYNHNIALSTLKFLQIIKKEKIISIEVNVLEDVSFILNAHSWLKNISQSYLGYINKGGGATFEHSHGYAMLLNILEELDLGKIKYVNTFLKKDKNKNFDISSINNFKTSKGILCTVNQNFISRPSEKFTKVITTNGTYILKFSYKNNNDKIINNYGKEIVFKKSRADDFLSEIKYINKFSNSTKSKLSLKLAKYTHNLLICCLESNSKNSTVIFKNYV